MSGCDFSYLQSLLLGEDDLNNVDTVCWGDFDLDRYQLPHTEDVDFDDSFLENIFGFSNSDNKNAETIEYNDDKEIYMTESIVVPLSTLISNISGLELVVVLKYCACVGNVMSLISLYKRGKGVIEDVLVTNARY